MEYYTKRKVRNIKHEDGSQGIIQIMQEYRNEHTDEAYRNHAEECTYIDFTELIKRGVTPKMAMSEKFIK